MLNEKKEYSLYLKKGYGSLLRRDNLKNDLAGIRQALTILARGFLELCESEGCTSISEKTALCKDFLYCFMTGDCNLSKDLPIAINHEFKKAKNSSILKHIVDNEIKIRSVKDCGKSAVCEYLHKKMASWENSMFFSLQKNSVNEIYFKSIIADALHKGALTNKRLVLKTTHGIECDGEACENIGALFCIVAACLQNIAEGQCSVAVRLAQISNLLNKPTCKKKKRDSDFACLQGFVEGEHFTYKGSPIITKLSLAGGVVKLCLNEQWLRDADVHLVSADEKIGDGYAAFSDGDF
ncbi:MAG: hypothetical protein IIW33_02985 [Oscillospiraceae bacterium]|nr:hypothetical protein [Oscillospiraceae bacterium]